MLRQSSLESNIFKHVYTQGKHLWPVIPFPFPMAHATATRNLQRQMPSLPLSSLGSKRGDCSFHCLMCFPQLQCHSAQSYCMVLATLPKDLVVLSKDLSILHLQRFFVIIMFSGNLWKSSLKAAQHRYPSRKPSWGLLWSSKMGPKLCLATTQMTHRVGERFKASPFYKCFWLHSLTGTTSRRPVGPTWASELTCVDQLARLDFTGTMKSYEK